MSRRGAGAPGGGNRGTAIRDTGARGEELAARYLESEGYRVLDRNFRTRRGEIDIVAQAGDRVVFVEVKHWKVLGVEALEQSVGARKQSRIRAASRAYLMRHPELEARRISYDVVFLGADGTRPRHYRNAFDGV